MDRIQALAVIPARGGSKRIPNKNIRPFFGRPMLGYSLQTVERSRLFDEIHVSTDDPSVSAVASAEGFSPAFFRPSHLADDLTPLMPVLKWVLQQYDAAGRNFQTVALVMPCAPLLEPADLVAAHDLFARHGAKHPVLAVSSYKVAPEWAFKLDADGRLRPMFPGAFADRSQDMEKSYHDAGTFSLFHRDHILQDQGDIDRRFIGFELEKGRAVDIDDLDDWQLAEALFSMKTRRLDQIRNRQGAEAAAEDASGRREE